MNDTPLLTKELRTPRKLTLPSLVISYFAIWTPGVLAGLLLLDIGQSFDRSVGVAGQIQTAASLATAIVAVLMGVLSVRFKHKSLLLLGLLLVIISAVGCPLALNFTMMLLFFTFSGIGIGMVDPMTLTLVGEHFPLEQRGRAIGWVIAGAALAAIVGALIIGVIARFGGWRAAFLGFVLPITLLSLVFAAKWVPSPSRSPQSTSRQESYWEGFKGVFSNYSAIACLVGSVLTSAAWQAMAFYGISFLRERFLISLEFATILLLGAGLCYLLGNQVGGLLVPRFGRKPATVLTVFIGSIITIPFTNIPFFWPVLTLLYLGCVAFGMRATTVNSLTLEQVPSYRGSMMSLSSAAWYVGIALGTGVGGLALLWWDYEGVGLVLGALGIVSTLTFYFLTIDPTNEDLI